MIPRMRRCPWREVVALEGILDPRKAWTGKLGLQCGHTVTRTIRCGKRCPRKVRCAECGQAGAK